MSERQPKAVANDTVQTTTYRRGELCSPVFILYEICCGQGRALSVKGSLVKGAGVFLEQKND